MFGKFTMTTKLLTCLCLAVCLVQKAEGSLGRNCNETSQCASGECCQKLNQVMMVSRRNADFLNQKMPKHPGVCAQYKRLGAQCGAFDKENGYCDCEPGTECQSHKLTLKKRRFSRDLPLGIVLKCRKTVKERIDM